MSQHSESSQRLCQAMQTMASRHLSAGKSGNMSIRAAEGMLITPTGIQPALLEPQMVVAADFQGHYSGEWRPSSEWPLHSAIYEAFPEAAAIVHCHSRFATAIACTRREIPKFHYMIGVAGGDNIRCAPYANFGSQELAENVVGALQDRTACLLANHGQVCFGATIEAALNLAAEVEELAAQYWACLGIGGPILLSDEEMNTALQAFIGYGQQSGA